MLSSSIGIRQDCIIDDLVVGKGYTSRQDNNMETIHYCPQFRQITPFFCANHSQNRRASPAPHLVDFSMTTRDGSFLNHTAVAQLLHY